MMCSCYNAKYIFFCYFAGWSVHSYMVCMWIYLPFGGAVLCRVGYHYHKIWWRLCLHLGSLWTMSGISAIMGINWMLSIVGQKNSDLSHCSDSLDLHVTNILWYTYMCITN